MRGSRSRPAFLRFAAVAAALGVLAAAPAAAQSGPIVRQIEFTGLQALSEESLLFYLGLEVGKPLDEAVLNRAIHDLWSRQLVDDLDIQRRPADGGVALVVRVVERPVLRSIVYEGLKRVGSTDINDRILRERVQVREGAPLDLGELARLEVTLEEMYKEKGYRFAEISYRLEEITATERRAVFTVDEGDRVRIAGIRFEGNEAVPDRRLRWAMRKTKESGPVSRILKKDVYNPATVAEDLEKVRDVYRRAGYKNVLVSEPELVVQAMRPEAPTPTGQKRRLFLDIDIDEGERFKFGDITIEGNEKYSDEALLSQFSPRRGGWLRSKVIDDGVEKISDAYRNTGFLYSRVTTELVEKDDQVADVVIHIEEGDQYKVGRLEFEGNDRTKDKVLRREFRVHEGMFLNMGGLRNSLLKVRQLEFFQPDENEPIEFTNFDSEKKTVDLLVKGQESDRTELEFGGGWSEPEGFFAQFSVRTRNFLGRGEALGVTFVSGSVRDEFDVSYFVPWFLDRPQNVGLQVFRRDQDYEQTLGLDYLLKQRGSTLTYGRSFYFSSASLSYTFSDQQQRRSFASDVVGPLPTIDPFCTAIGDGVNLTENCDSAISVLRPQWAYNTVDSRLEPTRGRRLTGSVSVAGGLLGGDRYYYRPELSAALFVPLTRGAVRTVGGVNLEAGMIEPFGGRPLSSQDRYYLGREIRGFGRSSIWVRDDEGQTVLDPLGFPLGGDKWVSMNVEYHVLLGGPFRLIFFADAGNVYGEDQSFDLTRLRYSAGAEFRIVLPVFGAPLRFVYASNLDPIDDPGPYPERFDSFQFDIGTTF
jgi:outer membrane protein insertion porin family